MRSIYIDTNVIAEICRQNDVASLSLFGSVAEGEATESSDVTQVNEMLKQMVASLSDERNQAADS